MGKRKYTDEELSVWEDVLAGRAYEILVEAHGTEAFHMGEHWYAFARFEVELLAKAGNISTRRAAAIVAVLSPRTRWTGNIEDAWAIINDDRIAHALPRNARKAFAIFDGEPIDDHVRGPKVTSFFANLSNEYSRACTNDSWIAEAFGVSVGDLYGVKGVYEMVSRAIERATASFNATHGYGLRTYQGQAIIWTHTRGVKVREYEALIARLPNPMEV